MTRLEPYNNFDLGNYYIGVLCDCPNQITDELER